MIQHPNKYRRMNPALLKLAMGKGAGNGGGGGGVPAAIHFWPMNEGTGTVLHDNIGTTNLNFINPNWGVLTGMGSAAVAEFNNTSPTYAVAAAYDPTLDFNGTTPFSVSVWIYTTLLVSETFIGNLTSTDSTFRGWELTTGGSSGIGLLLINNLSTSDEAFYLDGSYQTPNVATQVLLTYDGAGTAKLYLNGSNVAVGESGTLATPGFTSATPLAFGLRSNNTNAYAGGMAYARIWNQVLTPAQVTALYTLGPQ